MKVPLSGTMVVVGLLTMFGVLVPSSSFGFLAPLMGPMLLMGGIVMAVWQYNRPRMVR